MKYPLSVNPSHEPCMILYFLDGDSKNGRAACVEVTRHGPHAVSSSMPWPTAMGLAIKTKSMLSSVHAISVYNSCRAHCMLD